MNLKPGLYVVVKWTRAPTTNRAIVITTTSELTVVTVVVVHTLEE